MVGPPNDITDKSEICEKMPACAFHHDFCLGEVFFHNIKKPRLETDWRPIASAVGYEVASPSRGIIEQLRKVKSNPTKTPLNLSNGNITLTPPQTAINALQECLMSGKYHGYPAAGGMKEAREAVATYVNSHCYTPVSSNDVLLTHGVSFGLDSLIQVLARPGDNILIPNPGYPLYANLMKTHGIEARPYEIKINASTCRINTENLSQAIDTRTVAILLNNPLNPTGTIFPQSTLEAILDIAEHYRLPIITDEIYGGMTMPWLTKAQTKKFVPLSSLKPRVPIITVDGISKRFMLPGWRIGWIVLHDFQSVFRNIRAPLERLVARMNGPCSVAQAALPATLNDTPSSFHDQFNSLLETNANTAIEILSQASGLSTLQPDGAIYLTIFLDMSVFPGLRDDIELAEALIREESVFCLPGSVFYMENCAHHRIRKVPFLRMVLSHDTTVIEDACKRIVHFCKSQ